MLDAYCASCGEPTPHAVPSDDPACCFCDLCGAAQTLVTPLAA